MAAGEQQSRAYLERHGLPALLHRLSALLLYHRPERPRQFLIEALEAAKAGRRGALSLMEEADLRAMFQMLDAAERGFITAAQHRGALQALGLSTEELPVAEGENITLHVFMEDV
ncbi:EFC10 protein, partial [Penelope pileata]|nr:EFC10 protein [Penelope pileata]